MPRTAFAALRTPHSVLTTVRHRLAIISLIAAWLCANGAVWDVAQMFAWSRMFTGYAQSLSMSDALRETFDASKPCPMCQAIAQAKAAEQKLPQQQLEQNSAKLTLAFESPAQIFLSVPSVDWPSELSTLSDPRIDPVPLPPPRV